VRAAAFALLLSACSGAVYGPALDRALLLCQNESKAALRNGASFDEALGIYERCKLREGAF
jgi:hypothetical protein